MASGRQANLVGAWTVSAACAIRAATEAAGNAAGASPAALLTVALFPGERIDSLRRVLGLSPSGAVRVVDQLVSGGLVERRASAKDAREALIHPTVRGSRVARRVLAARDAAVQQLLEPLSEQECAQLFSLLERLLVALPSDRDDARHICRLCDHPACEHSWCPVSAGALGEPHRSRVAARVAGS